MPPARPAPQERPQGTPPTDPPGAIPGEQPLSAAFPPPPPLGSFDAVNLQAEAAQLQAEREAFARERDAFIAHAQEREAENRERAKRLESAESALLAFAPDPEEIAKIQREKPEEADEYSETFRSMAFVAKTKICVGPGRYIPPGTMMSAGSVPRSELEPLWRLGGVEPYTPPAPAPPKALGLRPASR